MPFQDGSNGPPILRADLLGTEGQGLLPLLYHVRVGRVQGMWLSVTGTEHVPRSSGSKSKMDHYRQTWWCLVDSAWPTIDNEAEKRNEPGR